MEETQTKTQRIKAYLAECYRVLLVTKKPNKTEFKTVVKVSGLGILVIGLIGFILNLIYQLIVV
ncbi:MAG TPA: protein translocase SEC61 complex subunit gamma [Candidatus Nanoarchaeia archaeon]|nr:protein translocase SEC61 complex subunit gamma [Candidatus Nanoarchaeia archaeon]